MAGSANVTIGYAGSQLSRDPAPVMAPIESQTFATSEVSSTQSTITGPTTNRTGRDIVARVFLSEVGWVWQGANPTANKTTTGVKVAANTEYFVALNPGDKLAILDDA